MPQSAQPSRLVILAGPDTAVDSRTGRTAVAAARDGWDVTILAPGTGTEVERSAFGPVQVVRVPVGTALRDRAAQRAKGHRLRRMITQYGLTASGELGRLQAGHGAWVRQSTARAGSLGAPARQGAKAWIRMRREVHRMRVRVYRWEGRQDLRADAPTGDWRVDWPVLLDEDLAVGGELEKLEPRIVHVHDVSLLATAALSAARLRARGVRTRWLYDISSATEEADLSPERRASAYRSLEREFAGGADALTAATERLAQQVPGSPLVVREALPAPAATDGKPLPAVRNLCGLHGAGPLWVYAGALDGHHLETVFAALAQLPEHHLALVSAAEVPEAVLALADKRDVRDRVHTPASPPPGLTASFLASADAAVASCACAAGDEPARDLLGSLYTQAGLPVVDACGAGPTDLAKALSAAVDPERRTGEDTRRTATWEHRVRPLLDLYRELAGGPALSPRPELGWDGEPVPVPKADARPARPLPTWTPLTRQTPVRLGLGPANYAGQLASFAHAVCRTRPDVSAQVFMATAPGTFNYPADIYLDSSKLGRLTVMLEQAERVFRNYTHVLADAFLPVLGRLNGSHLEDDLPALLRTSIKVALLAHGSEIRHPLHHMDRVAHSLFHDAPEGMVDRLTKVAERNRATAERFGLPSFVTTPDLLDDLPSARWAPLVVDVDAFACDRPVMERERPVVLHAPSKRWTKGTDRALPVLTELHDRGVIEFRLAEQVDWTEMRELVKDADIVVDQFAIGSYGTFACEGMAAGKPVVAYLTETVAEALGEDNPVVNATPDSLRTALESLLDDRHATALLGERSARFARKYHDGTRTAAVLADFLS
ncbi:glycosyltransferase [Streptomyces sp. SP18CS02]|uniref:glycosyltransferase n=1 Tax=Streptomyces sp. SP18CS02 TaxID=3002531 RepID=UPI002E793B26|nr:glycosyltransferase [Streptomyces sp. SP18CS02]MEE1753596.1 glycosyltransferase [Streptomyces sp. SP18CS02]